MENLNTKIVITGDSLSWRVKLVYQVSAWVLVLSTTLGTLFAVGLAYQNGIGVLEVSLFVFMYALSGIGITVGYHRLFSHRAFDAPLFVQVILGILGALACQGPLIYWVSTHRRHHQFSDRPGDPHSPYTDLVNTLPPVKGFLHAHMGWIFRHDLTNTFRFSKDLFQDPVL
ncbi:MAG: acyl-CoA desaturase, partial [Candidatus Latescibacterota bacterium]